MTQKNLQLKWLAVVVLLIAIATTAVWLRSLHSTDQQLSVKPARAYSDLTFEPLESNIGIQAKLPYRSLTLVAEHVTAEPQSGNGEKQSCKKILGAEVCATLQWQYSIQRDGEVTIAASNDSLQLMLPISFNGLVSVDGRGGKLLGLRDKNIDGKLQLIADLDIDIKKNWCPQLNSKVSYKWLSDPRITLAGKLRINLRKSVDRALSKKLTELQSLLTDVIDCEALRRSLQAQWHTHKLDIDLGNSGENQLHITPVGASVSDVGIQKDHIQFSFDLGATVQMKQTDVALASSQVAPPQRQQLPDLAPQTNNPGTVEFSLLLEVPYTQLRDKIAEKTVGETYGADESNGLTVTTIDLYPAGAFLIIDVGFKARALGPLIQTTGHVYISARPVPDPTNNRLILEDLQLTRSIDSRLMSTLATLLREQLLAALQEVSVIDLGSSMAKIESSVEQALSNPEKTGGIQIQVQTPKVRLMALNPQANGLAAIIHLSTQLNATVPEDVLIR